MFRTCLKVAAGVLPAVAAVLAFALPASAAPISVSGTTYLPDNLDSGNGTAVVHGLIGGWAIDTFDRTLTVETSPACTLDAPSAAYTCYSATISDSGTFTTLPGNGRAPNPNSVPDPGTNIAYPPVSGPFSGSDSYLFWATEAPAVANIADVVNNHGDVASGKDSTSGWYAQAFPVGTDFAAGNATGIEQDSWGWNYASVTGVGKHTLGVVCESWTDSYANGAGDTPADSNVTGKQCAGSPKPHYTRVPDCLSRRVYICTGLLAGRGLGWVIENPRKPRVAYFVKGQTPDPGAVVLKGTVVHLNDVHKL
jgi:hypothetical protein